MIAAGLCTGTVGAVAFGPFQETAPTSAYGDDPAEPWITDAVATLMHQVKAAHKTAERESADPGHSQRPAAAKSAALPPRSGTGRRAVFDISSQRVWIVGVEGKVRSTYLVSGSRFDNLRPGRYRVFSRSRHAVVFGGHSTMEYFVRFARGQNSNIGFHDIPVDGSGKPVQTKAALGAPRSAGCIRQHREDAKRMWRFATMHTRVVVVA